MVTQEVRSPAVERAFKATLTLLAVVAFLRGFRPPSGWAATEFCFNYSHGFIRRGLLGEIVRQVAGDAVYSYPLISAIAFIVLFGSMGLLLHLFNRARRGSPETDRDGLSKLSALVFASSAGLVLYVQEVGYLDQVGLFAVLGLILLMSSDHASLGSYLVVALGCFLIPAVHEVLVPLFAPVAFFVLACRFFKSEQEGERGSRLWLRALATVLSTSCAAASVVLVGYLGTRSHRVLDKLRADVFAKATFPPFSRTFDTLSSSFKEDVLQVMPSYWNFPGHFELAVHQLLVVLPALLFFLIVGEHRVIHLPISRGRRVLLGLILLSATLSPLALNAVGWDSGRWAATTLINGFCCAVVAQLFFPEPARSAELPPEAGRPRPWKLWGLGVTASALSLCGDAALFPDFRVQLFPFDGQITTLWHLIAGGLRFIPGY